VQFEDDEYYYYVKAIPKYNVDTNKSVQRVSSPSDKNRTSYAEIRDENSGINRNAQRQLQQRRTGNTQNLTSSDKRF
jgi:hypothetical protein